MAANTSLNGKNALITGATNGIGLEAAVVLAEAGAKLTIVGRDQARTEAALAEIKSRSGAVSVDFLLCDFSSQESIRKLAADYRASHTKLELLVNNAGLQDRQLLLDATASEWDRINAVNARGSMAS